MPLHDEYVKLLEMKMEEYAAFFFFFFAETCTHTHTQQIGTQKINPPQKESREPALVFAVVTLSIELSESYFDTKFRITLDSQSQLT